MALFCCCCSTFILFVISLISLLKLYIKATTGIYKGKERLEGKTVIVTGASAGIGAESAKDFAKRGARVIMLCRDIVKGESVRRDIEAYTGNKNLVIKHIDFCSLESVRRCAQDILAEESRIDVLLNNAGVGGLAPRSYTQDGFETLIQVNHFGPFLLTNILLGKIQQSAPSRIVFVSSVAHKIAELNLDNLNQSDIKSQLVVYGNSKLANIYCAMVLAKKLKGTGVTANSLHPGIVTTEISRDIGFLLQRVWTVLSQNIIKSAWEGAQTQIYLCISPSVANVSGKYFSDCREVSTSQTAQDYREADKLWRLSEKAVKLMQSEKFIQH